MSSGSASAVTATPASSGSRVKPGASLFETVATSSCNPPGTAIDPASASSEATLPDSPESPTGSAPLLSQSTACSAPPARGSSPLGGLGVSLTGRGREEEGKKGTREAMRKGEKEGRRGNLDTGAVPPKQRFLRWTAKLDPRLLFKRGSATEAELKADRIEFLKHNDRPRSSSLDLGQTSINHGGTVAQSPRMVLSTPPNSMESLQDINSISDEGGSSQDLYKRRGSRSFEPPQHTISHVATAGDSLASIAVQYNTTSSELRSINRLMASLIHPGQIIYVPDKDYVAGEHNYPRSPNLPRKTLPSGQDDLGRKKSGSSSDSESSLIDGKKKDDKKNKKTNKNKPLYLGQAQKVDDKDVPLFAAEVQYLTGYKAEDSLWGVLTISPSEVRFDPRPPEDEQQLGVWEIVSYRMSLGNVLRSVKLCDDNPMFTVQQTPDSSKYWSTAPSLNNTNPAGETSAQERSVNCEERGMNNSETTRNELNPEAAGVKLAGGGSSFGSGGTKDNKDLLAIREENEGKEEAVEREGNLTEKEENRKKVVESKPTFQFDNGTPSDNVSLDSHGSTVKYLRLKLGQKVQPTVSHLIERTFQLCSMSMEGQLTESWTRHCFTIPIDRLDELSEYLVRWYPEQLSKTAHVAYLEKQKEKQVRKISNDRRVLRRKLSVLEMYNLPLPDMSQPSTLITDIQIRILLEHFLPMADGRPWQLVYSTDKHGFSLSTLYRCTAKLDSATLILIEDTQKMLFGAMLPCSLKCFDGYYGTGESFLFTFHPTFKKFGWGGKNDYFINGTLTSLSIGSGDGVFGLWMDDDLHRGRTETCATYDNDPLTSSTNFFIKSIEVWGFPFKLLTNAL